MRYQETLILTHGATITEDQDGIDIGLMVEYAWGPTRKHGFSIPAYVIPTPDSLRAFGAMLLAAGFTGWTELLVRDGDVIAAEWVDAATGAVTYLA